MNARSQCDIAMKQVVVRCTCSMHLSRPTIWSLYCVRYLRALPFLALSSSLTIARKRNYLFKKNTQHFLFLNWEVIFCNILWYLCLYQKIVCVVHIWSNNRDIRSMIFVYTRSIVFALCERRWARFRRTHDPKSCVEIQWKLKPIIS